MFSPVDPVNVEVDELRWNRYRCEDCGKMYKSTGKQRLIYPDCRFENVVKV